MSKKKLFMIIALCFIVTGILVSLAVLAVYQFDYSKFHTDTPYEKKIYTPAGEIHSINVEDVARNVEVLLSEDNTCRVECAENNKEVYDIQILDGTLTVKYKNMKKWYEFIGLYFSFQFDTTVRVYLPQQSYNKVHVKTVSGGINLNGIVASQAEVISTSGDIKSTITVLDSILLKTTSGDISVLNAQLPDISIQTTSGKVILENIQANGLSCNSVSGNFILQNCDAPSYLNVNTTSGDIQFDKVDSNNFGLRTVSGQIKGTIKSSKQFSIQSVSGDIDVPISDINGGKFDAVTTSGDIKIQYVFR